jgi:hypothetical protein
VAANDPDQGLTTALKLANSLLSAPPPTEDDGYTARIFSIRGIFLSHQTYYLEDGGRWREMKANWLLSLIAILLIITAGVLKLVLPALVEKYVGPSPKAT